MNHIHIHTKTFLLSLSTSSHNIKTTLLTGALSIINMLQAETKRFFPTKTNVTATDENIPSFLKFMVSKNQATTLTESVCFM